jgi:hypothetical protein
LVYPADVYRNRVYQFPLAERVKVGIDLSEAQMQYVSSFHSLPKQGSHQWSFHQCQQPLYWLEPVSMPEKYWRAGEWAQVNVR